MPRKPGVVRVLVLTVFVTLPLNVIYLKLVAARNMFCLYILFYFGFSLMDYH